LSELLDKGWKLGSIDRLLKRSRKTGTIVLLAGSGRPRQPLHTVYLVYIYI